MLLGWVGGGGIVRCGGILQCVREVAGSGAVLREWESLQGAWGQFLEVRDRLRGGGFCKGEFAGAGELSGDGWRFQGAGRDFTG